MLTLLLVACTPDKVGDIEGRVLVGPGVLSSPLVDGSVTVLGDDATFFDEATTDFEGRFRATAPRGLNIFVIIEGDGMVPTTFSGVMGQGTFVVNDGELFAWPVEDRVTLDTDFGDCAQEGAVMTGVIRFAGVSNVDTGEGLEVPNGFASAFNEAGDEFRACYVNADGVYDPEAEDAGPSARYAIYGLEEGFHELVYGYRVTADVIVEHSLLLWVSEGAVVPQFPAWADLNVE